MKNVLTIVLLSISILGYSQTVNLVQGDLKPLNDQSSLNLEFTYDGMTVGEEGLSEADYIKRKKEDYDKKEPGRGDRWEESWIADRNNRFEPKFKELFEKYAKKGVNANSKYTLIFHTTRTEPGWLATGLIRKSARIDGEVFVVETANRQNVIAQLSVINARGAGAMGYDYDTGLRIQEAYSKSGKEIAKLIVKK